MVAEALRAQQGGAGSASDGGTQDAEPGRGTPGQGVRRGEGQRLPEFGCLSAQGKASAQSTARMFLDLSRLMDGFVPPSPPTAGEPPDRCLTAVAARNDPMAARIEQGLVREFQERRRAAGQARREALAEFAQTVRPVAWTWLRVWIEGQPVTLRPATFGCYDYGWNGSSQNNCCSSCWRQRRPPVVATSEPELTRRARLSGAVHPESDLFCSVTGAEISGELLLVRCEGPLDGPETDEQGRRPQPGTDQQFMIELPATLANAPDAMLGTLGVGDLIRVGQHLMITRRFERIGWNGERATWVVRDVPASAVSVVERSTCCNQPVPAAGGAVP